MGPFWGLIGKQFENAPVAFPELIEIIHNSGSLYLTFPSHDPTHVLLIALWGTHVESLLEGQQR